MNCITNKLQWQLIGALFIFFCSCNKYLEERADKTQTVPTTLSDLQALLDNHLTMNELSSPLSTLIADEFYLTSDIYKGRSEMDRLNYLWDKDARFPNVWINAYMRPIYTSNVVLSAIEDIPVTNGQRAAYRSIMGSALFYRAFQLFQLAQLYCRPYSTEAANDPGLVLRKAPDIETPSVRSSVLETYDMITQDLQAAAQYLPEKQQYLTRPDKAAAFGLLARVFLSMRQYEAAGNYADSALQLHGTLMDYNLLLPLKNPPISRFNDETIFYHHASASPSLSNTRAKIDTMLLSLFDEDDLRKIIFIQQQVDGSYGFQGSYDGTYVIYNIFDGVATNELFLIRAEALAQTDRVAEAIGYLNELLVKRWRTDCFAPYTPGTKEDAISLVRAERRKELMFRGLRWSDLRRYNEEGANISLIRIIDDVIYRLPSGDLRWVLLIPDEVIQYSSITQNPRK